MSRNSAAFCPNFWDFAGQMPGCEDKATHMGKSTSEFCGKKGEKSLQLGTVPPDQLHSFSDEFHVVFMAKAGTPFCDTVEVEEIDPMKNLEEYRPSDEYVQKAGMEWDTPFMVSLWRGAKKRPFHTGQMCFKG